MDNSGSPSSTLTHRPFCSHLGECDLDSRQDHHSAYATELAHPVGRRTVYLAKCHYQRYLIDDGQLDVVGARISVRQLSGHGATVGGDHAAKLGLVSGEIGARRESRAGERLQSDPRV